MHFAVRVDDVEMALSLKQVAILIDIDGVGELHIRQREIGLVKVISPPAVLDIRSHLSLAVLSVIEKLEIPAAGGVVDRQDVIVLKELQRRFVPERQQRVEVGDGLIIHDTHDAIMSVHEALIPQLVGDVAFNRGGVEPVLLAGTVAGDGARGEEGTVLVEALDGKGKPGDVIDMTIAGDGNAALRGLVSGDGMGGSRIGGGEVMVLLDTDQGGEEREEDEGDANDDIEESDFHENTPF